MSRGPWPLDPKVHPTAPERAAMWHASQIKRLAAKKTWKLLASHLLFELRACPVCGLPVLRWRKWDEIQHRILWSAVQAAGGQMSLVSRRLKMSRRTLYNHLPATLRKRIDEAKAEAKPAPEPEGGGP